MNVEENDKKQIVKYMSNQTDKIDYYKGDVLQILENEDQEFITKILIHICNNKGGWGAGFVLNLSKKHREPEIQYRLNFKNKVNCTLGDIQIVKLKENFYVINMIAQNGYKTIENPTPLDYNALESCLQKIMTWVNKNDFYFPCVYCPKIGTGLSGGDWDRIKNILNENLNELPIKVFEL